MVLEIQGVYSERRSYKGRGFCWYCDI